MTHKTILTFSILLLSMNLQVEAQPGSLCDTLAKSGAEQCAATTDLLDGVADKGDLTKSFNIRDNYYHTNQERQRYMADQVEWVGGTGGYLRLHAVYTGQAVDCGSGDPVPDGFCFFDAGEVTTKGKFTTTRNADGSFLARGAVEITARIPYGEGLWPALWMMPTYDTLPDGSSRWPSGMEIDMMEHMTPSPQVIGTVHYGDDTVQHNWNNNGASQHIPNDAQPEPFAPSEWHNYGFEWNCSDAAQGICDLTWFFDGEVFYQILSQEHFVGQLIDGNGEELNCENHWSGSCDDLSSSTLAKALVSSIKNGFTGDDDGYYLILNLAVGGNGVQGLPSDLSQFKSSYMDISSVRRYVIDAESAAEENHAMAAMAAPEAGCTPALIVVRHAEDMRDGESCNVVREECMAIPANSRNVTPCPGKTDACQCVHQHCLTPNGQRHAELYAEDLADWMSGLGLCPLNKIITQDPWTSQGDWPSANPFETALPLALKGDIPITFYPPSQEFHTEQRKEILSDSSHSTLIAWDKKGLYESSYPLLQNLAKDRNQPKFPDRDRLYLFTDQDPDTGKFDLNHHREYFQDSSGYFKKVVGSAYSSDQYYRFDDGFLRSDTPYSPDMVVSKMLICDKDCDGEGVTISSQKRQ